MRAKPKRHLRSHGRPIKVPEVPETLSRQPPAETAPDDPATTSGQPVQRSHVALTEEDVLDIVNGSYS